MPIFTFPYSIVFWLAFAWAFFPEFRIVQRARPAADAPDSQDGGSIKVIMTMSWIAMLIAFPVARIDATKIPERATLPVYFAGVLVLILGSVLRRACWRALGEYFTGEVRARADQPVIQTGPYRWVRHPSYTAGILMFAGIGLALTNWLSLLVLLIGTVTAYGYRVRVEERALLETIGEPYAEYMRTRKRFVPYLA